MVEQASLFDNMKFCAVCHRSLPESYEEELCPVCQENQLFGQVREYIRANDVNEYQVAEHFDIPRRQVKKWIEEGRIEYKEQEKHIKNLHCSVCGEPISYGSLCQKCYREKYHTKSAYATLRAVTDEDKMRFLDKSGSK